MSDRVGTESKKTYTSFDQFCRVTSVVGLKVLCGRLRSCEYGSRHLDSDVLIIRFLVCLRPELKELSRSRKLVFHVVRRLRRKREKNFERVNSHLDITLRYIFPFIVGLKAFKTAETCLGMLGLRRSKIERLGLRRESGRRFSKMTATSRPQNYHSGADLTT